jgi:hypothetical protein
VDLDDRIERTIKKSFRRSDSFADDGTENSSESDSSMDVYMKSSSEEDSSESEESSGKRGKLRRKKNKKVSRNGKKKKTIKKKYVKDTSTLTSKIYWNSSMEDDSKYIMADERKRVPLENVDVRCLYKLACAKAMSKINHEKDKCPFAHESASQSYYICTGYETKTANLMDLENVKKRY